MFTSKRGLFPGDIEPPPIQGCNSHNRPQANNHYVQRTQLQCTTESQTRLLFDRIQPPCDQKYDGPHPPNNCAVSRVLGKNITCRGAFGARVHTRRDVNSTNKSTTTSSCTVAPRISDSPTAGISNSRHPTEACHWILASWHIHLRWRFAILYFLHVQVLCSSGRIEAGFVTLRLRMYISFLPRFDVIRDGNCNSNFRVT
mmetsp:Transcript_4735/g.10669  ORF Transcript_4735/g.10669 Transcript_4735/m.10669 type:complete len:200 (-) Transcript_4735:31-630(-)